jgi:hypothetical protein
MKVQNIEFEENLLEAYALILHHRQRDGKKVTRDLYKKVPFYFVQTYNERLWWPTST